jgi:hypothetical protein
MPGDCIDAAVEDAGDLAGREPFPQEDEHFLFSWRQGRVVGHVESL